MTFTENMKIRIVYFFLPLFLFGCSKQNQVAEQRPNVQPSSALPFQITVVGSAESQDQDEIKQQAMSFLDAKNYGDLEKLIAQLRSSKESYPDGSWKLGYLYSGFESPGDDAEDAAWQYRQKKIQDWINAKPESIAARITMARFYRDYAWKARGSGYANTVSDKQWQLFGERLNQAGQILNDAKTLNEKCPVYWSTLMQVGLGLQISKEQYNNAFNQAVEAYPDYAYYYANRATFLLPRWNGEEGEWEKDLTQSADKLGVEQGDILYAQVVWNVHLYGEHIDVFKENRISWDRVDRGFAGIRKKFPDSLAAKNERAHLAALAGDKTKAREYFTQTEGKVDLDQWNDKGEFFDAAKWAFEP